MEASENKAVEISPDGGVLKEIIKEGIGAETPSDGDTVHVHYTGRLLDGTVFDSSRDRGTPFDFVLGKGSVIKGWEIGIATMKRGECAFLTCKPEYAYGDKGSPPTIPADATLVFEVELLNWSMEDLSTNKDGGIQRRIITQGSGYISPKDGSTVNVHYVGKVKDKIFEERDVEFAIGEGCEHGIIEGLEVALQSFKKGETSLIRIKPKYAYGSTGKAEFNIAPDESLDYEVTLTNFEKVKEAWELNSDQKLEQSEIAKNKGTELFKAGKYAYAIKQYKLIISYLENDPGSDEESRAKQNSLLLAGQLNLAACYLKTGENQDAIKACDKALELQDNNVKGLFRRGQARMALKDYEQGKLDFQAVVKLDPENKAAKNQIIMCTNKLKEEFEKEKQTYKNMFAKFAEEDKRKEASRIHTTESGVWQNRQRVGDGLENSGPLNNNLGMENVELLPNNLTNP